MVSKFNKQRPVRRFRLEGHLIDRRFRRHWRNYIIQCGLAALALLIVLLVVDVVLQAAIVVAIASMPSSCSLRLTARQPVPGGL